MTEGAKTKQVVDLFCGCGGLSKGFELAGFKIVGAFDKNAKALSCYKKNFKHRVFDQDLSDTSEAIRIITELNPGIIIGGPPCQDFSLAGKRIEGSRAFLTICFAEIVKGVKPNFFVMENVAHAKKSNAYKVARDIFLEAGYRLTEQILDASYYEVPQRRKRFLVVGHLEGERGQFLLDKLIERASDSPSTVKAMFPNFPVKYYYRHPRTYERRAVFSIDEPAPTIRGVNRPRPKTYQAHANDKSKSNNVRALTYEERARIQTFPEGFVWPDDLGKSDLEQMIGNAVPVNFAKNVGLTLLDYICEIEENNGRI